MRDGRLNDKDREQWIDNDEGLYRMWKGSRLPKRKFIKENREFIDQAIGHVVGGTRPAHYLRYGS